MPGPVIAVRHQGVIRIVILEAEDEPPSANRHFHVAIASVTPLAVRTNGIYQCRLCLCCWLSS